MNSLLEKHNSSSNDVNKEVQNITEGYLILNDPVHVGSSTIFYRNWSITHSGSSLEPVLPVLGKTE